MTAKIQGRGVKPPKGFKPPPPKKVMKTRYKYIHFFALTETTNNKPRYLVVNNKYNEILGSVEWSIIWKRYIYIPKLCSVYSSDCLADIIDFIKQLEKR